MKKTLQELNAQVKKLDGRLGDGVGAKRERAKIAERIAKLNEPKEEAKAEKTEKVKKAKKAKVKAK